VNRILAVLADPTMQLFNGSGKALFINDNWKDTQQAGIQAKRLRCPTIWSRLSPSLCNRGITQPFLSGTNNTTDIGLVEVVGKAPGYYSYFTPSSSLTEQLEIDRSQRMTARASPPPLGAACHLSLRQRAFSSGSTRVSSLSSEQSGDIAVIVRPER
jgi:hypothetical protein